jgi:cytochrome P450 family 135
MTPRENRSMPEAAPEVRQPVVMQKLRFGFDIERFFAGARQRHGDAFTIRVLGGSWTVLADPGAVREVFAHGPDELNSGEANMSLRPLIGTRSVLLSDGEEHMRRRKLVLPSFHGERMRAYDATIRAMAAEQIAGWPLGVPAAALPRAQALTFEVILRTVFGVRDEARLGTLGGALRETLEWIMDWRLVLVVGFLGPERVLAMRRLQEQVEIVDAEIAKLVATRRVEADLAEREDILSLLLQARDESGEGLSDLEVRDELVTLLVGGHETTATLIAWALHDLARDPASQERLASGAEGFAEAVVTETLRLHPPAPLVLRRLCEPLTIAGHRLPAGATVAPSTLLVHRRADLYPNPWAFRPDRFLDRRPVASEWFPFGGAVRRCIGAAFAQFEARIVLEELTRAFIFAPASSRPERFGRRGPVLVPGRGARLIATRRG